VIKVSWFIKREGVHLLFQATSLIMEFPAGRADFVLQAHYCFFRDASQSDGATNAATLQQAFDDAGPIR
jgi:hypothetical protein